MKENKEFINFFENEALRYRFYCIFEKLKAY